MSTVAVYGAYGHTARFVIDDLRARGLSLVLAGRNAELLQPLAADDAEIRPAALDSPDDLDRALAGVAAVVNCAGPFGDTPPPLLDAARRAGVHYLDVAGEALVVLRTFTDHAGATGPVIAPALGFFGGLGDLLATVAVRDLPGADEVSIAVALDSWTPTRGTVLTGRRRAGRRVVFADGRLSVLPAGVPALTTDWRFPPPFGVCQVVDDLPTADVVTIARHLPVRTVHAHLHVPPAEEPGLEGPQAVDDSGRSAQQFLVEVVARRGEDEHRVRAGGRDIYAISAPLIGEATARVLDGRSRATGLITAGQAFDAEDLLRALPLTRLDLGTTADLTPAAPAP